MILQVDGYEWRHRAQRRGGVSLHLVVRIGLKVLDINTE